MATKDKLVVDIIDNGIGIAPDKSDNLFKPFSRADDALRFNYEGQGLGLYSCRLVLEKYGLGAIEIASSKKGNGTTVRRYIQQYEGC